MTIGPMQLVVVGFDGDVMESDVLDELFAASMAGGVKLLDVLVLEKDEEGQVWSSEISDLTFDEKLTYGALIDGLINLGADPEVMAAEGEMESSRSSVRAYSVLGLTPGEVNDLAFSIPSGHSAIVALFEHVWARNLYQAGLEKGGVILAQALLDPRGLVILGEELAAAQEAMAVVEAAGAIEDEAK